jgi:hypothetical protein
MNLFRRQTMPLPQLRICKAKASSQRLVVVLKDDTIEVWFTPCDEKGKPLDAEKPKKLYKNIFEDAYVDIQRN